MHNWLKQQIWSQIRLAREREPKCAKEVIETLNRLFRLGSPPDIDGFKPGIVLGFTGFGPFNRLARSFLDYLQPWLGKNWNPEKHEGINLLTRRGMWLVGPLVRSGHASRLQDGSIEAVPFKMWVGRGVMDPDRDVLKIDYDISDNKRAIRLILDEQVEIVPDIYLCKGLVKVRGKHRVILFFANRSPEADIGFV